MKRIANAAISFVTTIAMVVTTCPTAAIAAEVVPQSSTTAYEQALAAQASSSVSEASDGESGGTDSGSGSENATENGSNSSEGVTGEDSNSETLGSKASGTTTNAGSSSASKSASGNDADENAASTSTSTSKSSTAAESNSTGTNESSDDADDQGDLRTVECDSEDDFTIDVWTDPVSEATADGEAVSDAATKVKQAVLAGYDACASTVDLPDGTTVADVRAGMDLAYADAEHYWSATKYTMYYKDANKNKEPDDTEIAKGLDLFYVVDTANIDTVKADTEAKIDEALSWVDADNMSDFEAAQVIHDYLVRNCVYNTSAANSSNKPTSAHTAYGALVEKKPVCQGYAQAYKLLLGRLGIPCVFVKSDSMNHAWNMAQIGGSWYHVDVTWDDPLNADETTDGGFDVDVEHTYFLRSDSSMKNSLDHHDWEAAYTTPASDYSNRTYATYKGPIATATEKHTYAHKATASSNGVVFKVEWDDPTTKGEATTFHVTQTDGSSEAKVRMDVPQYWDNGAQESVCDPSRSAWGSYESVGTDGYDYTFEFTASGTYRCLFYFMDTTNGITYLRTTAEVTVNDSARPAVSTIVSNAVAQAKKKTDGSEYAMALWLHDWTLDQLEYDYSLNWCSAESGLTRGKGTCESYQRIYAKLLTAAGIENGRIEGNGHTWNAVKIDGKWCQMDLTWDDSSDNWYDNFDQRHIYFGLTDELMAIAHSDHTANYQKEGYAYRSTDLSNNYFVRNGKAAEWADAYKASIQAKLDAKQTSFSINATNATYPPGICGIQNGIIAATLNERTWTASDGSMVTLAATSNVTVTTDSSTKPSATTWTAVYDFAVEYQTAATSISGASVTTADQTYTGAALTPAMTVTLNGKTLAAGTDYTASYSNNVNAGTATVTVTGKGSYEGTATGTFKIAAADASKATVSVSTSPTYTGSTLTPTATVKLGSRTLAAGTDYSLSYANNTNAGTATVKATFKGNYSGSAAGTFKINAASLAGAKVSAASQTYTGSALYPSPTVTLNGKTLAKGTDYTVAYSNNTNAGTATVTVTGKGNYTGTAKGTFAISEKPTPNVYYQAHVQNIGWQSAVKNGATAGTSGKSLRVEAVKLWLQNAGYSGGIQIRAHVQNIGWQSWSTTGGTSGRSLRVEAMQIRLTGELANHYDVYYRVHAQNFGWMGWAKNGAKAGSSGYSYRLEAVQIKLVPKGAAAPGSTANAFRKPAMAVEYQAHVQNIGWQGTVSNGATAGTSGRSLRVEALRVAIANGDYDGGIQIRAHVQNIGWQGWSTTGGTSGKSLRVEAMQIRLTGELANHYDVYYRVHAQNFGWMGWAKNGQEAGSAGYSYRLEAVQVRLVAKGGAAPGSTANRYRSR